VVIDSHSNLGALEPTIIGTLIDERYDPDYIGEYFGCANPRCRQMTYALIQHRSEPSMKFDSTVQFLLGEWFVCGMGND
jgi:hypothetical protein